MKWIGLTGGIATGKSTIAKMLMADGYAVIDADKIARDVLKRGTESFKKTVEYFGRTLVQEDGEINRKLLGRIVFDDFEKRKALERITHPAIKKKTNELKKELAAKNHAVAFYDIPLLFETNQQSGFDLVVVVACSEPRQIERLMARNSLSASEATARVRSQIPIGEKASHADYVIWNDGDEEDLKFEYDKFIGFLKKLTSPKNSQKQ